MHRNIKLTHTFKALRQLPVEIPFSRVQKWVYQHSQGKPSSRIFRPAWIKRLLNRTTYN